MRRLLVVVGAISLSLALAAPAVATPVRYYTGPASTWQEDTLPTMRFFGADASYTVTSVACASTIDCWAVVTAHRPRLSHSYVAHYNGARWLHALGGTGEHWSSIDCVPGGDCTLTGDYHHGQVLIEHLGAHPTRELLGAEGFATSGAIGCTASGWCVVVATGRAGQATFEVNGAAARLIRATVVAPHGGSVVVHDVACRSLQECYLVGSAHVGGAISPLIARFNGGSWTTVPLSGGSGTFVEVACALAASCTAVGDVDGGTNGGEGASIGVGFRWSHFQRGTTSSGAALLNAGGASCFQNASCLVVVSSARYMFEAYVTHRTLGQFRLVRNVRLGGNSLFVDSLACSGTSFCVVGLRSPGAPRVLVGN